MPRCVMYYTAYGMLDLDQQAYFRYWRRRYEEGTRLDADASYVYLYIYELACEAKTSDGLESAWSKLLSQLIGTASDNIGHRLANWIVHLRLQRECSAFTAKWEPVGNTITFDEVTEAITDASLLFDLALAAGVAPPFDSLFSLQLPVYFDPESRTRIKRMLRAVDTSSLLEIADQHSPTPERVNLFHDMGWAAARLQLFGPLEANVIRFSRSDSIRDAVVNLLVALNDLSGAPPVKYNPRPAPVPTSDDTIGEAVRKAIGSLPQTSSIEGLIWSVERVFDDGALLLLMLVLWLENKPYIEGAISFSKDLRSLYEGVGADLGFNATIGTMRRDFWTLSHGPRAVWVLEPAPNVPNDVKTGVTVARFTKEMQHLLRGSAAREQAMHALAVRIARRRRTSADVVKTAFESHTGCSPGALI